MARLSNILRSLSGGLVAFWCPGCDEPHAPKVTGDGAWQYDGNVDAPTFSPSILVRGTKMTAEGEAMLARGEAPPNGQYPCAPTVCHSFVRGGRIEFLGDCTHARAGQTVPLPHWPNDFYDGDSTAEPSTESDHA